MDYLRFISRNIAYFKGEGEKVKKKLLISILVIMLLSSIIVASCSSATTSTSSTSPAASTTPSSTQQVTTSSAPATTPTATQANWWDKWGTPQYGGTLTTLTSFVNPGSFDPTAGMAGGGGFATNVWLEGLTKPDFTLDPKTWSYPTGFAPLQYLSGLLMDSWEQKDPQTLTIHIRQNVYWQDKSPVNGRQFTADDVVFNYDRALGIGEGYTQPIPMIAPQINLIKQVTAVDKYTVDFTFQKPGIMGVYQVMGAMFYFVPKEWVALGGPPSSQPQAPAGPSGPPSGGAAPSGQASPLTDWTKVVGTGPWILTNFVSGSAMTLSPNPNYYLTDGRFPGNKLPYATTLTELAIPDPSTALAALRTGKIDMWTDMMGHMSWQQGQSLQKTDPNIQQIMEPQPGATLMLRCDKKPFTDIRVRQALQLAIDISSIAKNYYGGTSDGQPVGLVSPVLKGWALPYSQWSADLQAQYTYNPTKAKQLLTEAGYPNGFNTDVVASSNQDTMLLQVIQSEFKDIGVNMTINTMDPTTFGSFTAAGKQDQMVYSDGMAGMMWSPTTSLSYMTSAAVPQTNSTFNYDKKYDALYDQLNNAPDTETAMKLAIEAEQYALEQHWTVNLANINIPVAFQSYIKGYSGQVVVDNGWAGSARARVWIDQTAKSSSGQ